MEQVVETHKTFSIRIPNDLFDRLDIAVRRDGRSRNAVIVDALGRHLEFLRVVSEQSAALVASLSGDALKEVATNELFRGAAEVSRDAARKAETSEVSPARGIFGVDDEESKS